MKTPKIPKGWRKVRRLSTIKEGDRYWSLTIKSWHPTLCAGCRTRFFGGLTYIRRIQK